MQVLELGQVGKAGAVQEQNYTFYAHSQRAAPFGDAAGIVKALQHAAKHAGHPNVSGSLQRCSAHTLAGLLGKMSHRFKWFEGQLQEPFLLVCVPCSCCDCSSNTQLFAMILQ